MLQTLKNRVKAAMSPDQVAAVRIFLAGWGRRTTGTSADELWLDRLARAGEIKVFVQIGANDGGEGDPISSIIRRRGISGVMVEPIPYYCDKLRQRYSDRKDITVVNSAIAEPGEKRKSFYHLSFDDPTLPDWASGLGSFNRDVIYSHADRIPDIENKIIETTVECHSFSELLERCNLQSFDALVCDAEGYDYQIMKQVDLDTLQPKMVIFETKHLSEEEKEKSEALLRNSGYQYVVGPENTMAFRQDIASKWWRIYPEFKNLAGQQKAA